MLHLMLMSGVRDCGTEMGNEWTGKWADVVLGDTFRFTSTQDPANALTVRVTSVRQYDSFAAMLEGEGLERCLPGVCSLEEGVEVYRGIPGYREREGVDGVVGVGVQLLATE